MVPLSCRSRLARLSVFKIADAEEILRYAVRRTLMTQDETDRILADVKEANERRAERALEREKGKAAKKAAAVAPKPKPKPKAVAKKAPAKASKGGKKKK